MAWIAHHPEVALVDLELGGEPGSALLDETWVRDLDTAIVVLTGSDDVDVANESFENGASGYVVKPFTPNELLMQVSSALRRRDLERAVADHVRELEHKVIESTTGISDLRRRLETVTSGSSLGDEQLVRHLCSAVCLRDDDTGRHIERVSVTAAALADWCGFVADPAPAIRLAAALHDVGKIGIPDWVLLKPGRLTPDERTIIERHCELGHALLSGSSSPILILAASVALNHHERWDGKGYPNRRSGDDIPLKRASPRWPTFLTRSLGTACIERHCPLIRPSTSCSAIAVAFSIRGSLISFLIALTTCWISRRRFPILRSHV